MILILPLLQNGFSLLFFLFYLKLPLVDQSVFCLSFFPQQERFSVERALVRVRGVISLVFDPSKCRVACRVRRVLDLSKLGSAVDDLSMGLSLYQIVTKPEGGEEVLKAENPNAIVDGIHVRTGLLEAEGLMTVVIMVQSKFPI